MSVSPRPEWDTPPDGDFARYVERLSQTPPRPVQSPRATARAGRAGAMASEAPASPPPSLASGALPFLQVLRAVRAVFLVLTLVQAVALFLLGWGSMAALVVLGLLWWGLGVASAALARPAGRQTPVQSLLHALQQAARQPPNRK